MYCRRSVLQPLLHCMPALCLLLPLLPYCKSEAHTLLLPLLLPLLLLPLLRCTPFPPSSQAAANLIVPSAAMAWVGTGTGSGTGTGAGTGT